MKTTTIRTIALFLVALVSACTDANPGRTYAGGLDVDTGSPAADHDGSTEAPAVPSEPGDSPADPAGGVRVEDATDVTPETCDNPLESARAPDCSGGEMEREPGGLIVCRWPCVAYTDTTVVIRKRGPCYVVEDMVCHQCADRIPEHREPAAMVCPDVVALAW